MEKSREVKYDPKRLKHMKRDLAEINKKIGQSRKKHDNMIRRRNNLRKAIDDIQRAKPPQQEGPIPPPRHSKPEFRELERAFGRVYQSYRTMGRPKIDPDTLFASIRKQLIQSISRELNELRSARVQTTTWIRFRQDYNLVELAFNSRMTELHKASDIEGLADLMINHMREQIENPALINSRFVFDEVLFMDVNFHRLNLTRGGTHLPLPKFIERSKAVINPQNQDNECFKWAVIAALHNSEIKSHPERISNFRKFEHLYDWLDIYFPTSIKDIKKFEFRNSILVNVMGLEDNDIYICRKGPRLPNYKEVNLLMVCNSSGGSEDSKQHCTAVKSLSRLLGSSNSKHFHKQHFCMNCLQGFNSEKTRDEHFVYCSNNEMVRVEMPKETIFKFSDGQGQLKAPFVTYADFESILEPMSTCTNDPTSAYTNHINKHIPSGFCTYSTFT